MAPDAVIADARVGAQDGVIVDALEDGASSRALVDTIGAASPWIAGLGRAGGDSVRRRADAGYRGGDRRPTTTASSRPSARSTRTQQFAGGDKYLLKVFRLVEDGRSHGASEIGRFLTTHAPRIAPDIVGAVEYVCGRGEPRSIAALARYVPNEGTAWEHAHGEIQRFYDRVVARSPDAPAPSDPNASLVLRAKETPSAEVLAVIGSYPTATRRSSAPAPAELHLALAASDVPAFSPVPFSTFDRRSLYQSLRNLVGRVMRTLRSRRAELSPRAVPLARALFDDEAAIVGRFESAWCTSRSPRSARAFPRRLPPRAGAPHGGATSSSSTSTAGTIFDLPERRRKRSPLRDVAGMVRSFHYAAYSAIYDGAVVRETGSRDRAAVGSAVVGVDRGGLPSWLSGARAVGASFLPTTDESTWRCCSIASCWRRRSTSWGASSRSRLRTAGRRAHRRDRPHARPHAAPHE